MPSSPSLFSLPSHVPQVRTNTLGKQPMPACHADHLCTYHKADEATVKGAIKDAVAAQKEWESMPWNDRAAIFLKAADLISGKYREQILAATILGQGKNAWQAEIDAAAEVRVHNSYFSRLLTKHPLSLIALRFPPFWCQIRRRALRTTAAQKCSGNLEQGRIPPSRRIHARHLSLQFHCDRGELACCSRAGRKRRDMEAFPGRNILQLSRQQSVPRSRPSSLRHPICPRRSGSRGERGVE